MAWFKVDDTFPHHAKVLAAGNAATGLWVRAGAWSMQQLTDGFIPEHVATTLGTKIEAARLVKVGLWVVVDDGFQFHQWTDVQRTKEQVKADRDAATERQRRAREVAKSRRESRRDTGVSHGPPVSRPPDQTRPDQTSTSYGSSSDADASDSPSSDRFEEFWDTYDKKVDRSTAEKKWRLALKKPGVTADMLIACASAYVTWERVNNENGRYIMGPAKWLLNERWNDERASRPETADNVRHLPNASEVREAPAGLTDEQYDQWMREGR